MRPQKIVIACVPLVLAATLLAAFSGCDFRAPKKLISPDQQGQPERGKMLVFAYGCVACHQVSGSSGYPSNIGPPLIQWSRQKYIAGELPNQPEMLVRWIVNPDEVEPETAMPNLGVTETDARDIAAYLYSQ